MNALMKHTADPAFRMIIDWRFFIVKPRALLFLPLAWQIRAYTMAPFSSVYQMQDHLRELACSGIQGAVVEAGCWKGGLGASMARSGRETWLFDSFEGMPEFTEKDIDIVRTRSLPLHTKTGLHAVPITYPQEIAARLGVKTHVVKGWFKDTLPEYAARIGPIALLRLDGDTYDSTMQTLDSLYDQVAMGGVVVIDDFYSFTECRQAVYDFFAKRQVAPKLFLYRFGRAYFTRV